jgi:hypothetical protein
MAEGFSFSHKRGQIFVPYNGKIADITHADTNHHYLDLASALSEARKIIAIIPKPIRIAGTGSFNTYPNEGAVAMSYSSAQMWAPNVIKDGTQRLEYALGVANDDWDFYCLGYIVEA